MYLARLGELFEEVWHEEELASEAERIGALTEAPEELITTQRDFIFRQGDALRAELMITPEDAPAWIDGPEPRPEPDNCDALNLAGMNGTFETVWRIGLPGPGGAANVIFAENPILTGSLLTSAGVDPAVNPNVVNILLVSTAQGLAVLVRVPLAYFEPGRTIAMHGLESNAILLRIDLPSIEFEFLGFVGGGTITFDEASTVPGQPVSGSFEGLFAQINVF